MTCPSITELCAADAAAVFKEHLASCIRCRALVANCQAQDDAPIESSTIVSAPAGARPEPRAVWTIWAPTVEQYLVAAVLEATEEEALVVPLMPWANWASEADVALDSEALGYSAIAPLWASDRVLVEQAVEVVDVLSESCYATLSTAYDAFFAGEEINAETGVPILSEEDPRLEAQTMVAEELHSWFLPWSTLHSAEELGPVMGQRRECLGIELDAFSEEVEVEPKDWRKFEAGQADPYATIPVPAMAKAVGQLCLVASSRLLSLARASVLANNETQTADQPAHARRRRGSMRKRGRDVEAAKAAADQYAASLAKELGL